MIAKLGFLIVVLLFGALMFVAGTLAPENLRSPVAAFGRHVAAKLTAAAGDAKAAPASASAEAGKEPPPIPSESLQLPVPLPAQGQYALQAGQFAVPEPAAALAKRLQAAGVPFQVLPVVDRAGQRWSLVAAGQYGSVDEARTARLRLADDLGISGALPVILLPAAPAS